MKVIVKSIATVKPCLPTAKHLSHYRLSILDQLNQAHFMPVIFFYSKPDQPIVDHLKSSLSEALVSFYPLAGRLSEDALFIHCNDSGVHFSEAEVDCSLSDVLGDPNAVDLNELLPFHDIKCAGDLSVAVQVNVFECGGVAIGVCFSHKVADLLSLLTFVNSWAAVARNSATAARVPRVDELVKFNLETLFPQRKFACDAIRSTTEKIVSRRFIFGGESISSLKEKYSNTTFVNPTTVEALTTFIWSRYSSIATDFTEGGIDPRSYIIYQAVNLRKRMTPPLLDSSFGNIYRYSIMVEPPLPHIDNGHDETFPMKMRNAVRKMDSYYVKRIQKGVLEDVIVEEEGIAKRSRMGFTGVFRFPFYEADFGWGKPTWVSSARIPFRNSISFFPTGSGVGVDAWISMKEEDIIRLEEDKEFLAFACAK